MIPSSTVYLAMVGLAVAAFLMTHGLCRVFAARGLFPAHANMRSSHRGSTSRAGGLAIMLSFLLAAAIGLWLGGAGPGEDIVVLLVVTLLMSLLGLIDDVASMGAGVKFAGQAVLAIAFIGLTGPVATLPLPVLGETDLGVLGYAVALAWIVAFVNVFNFMDGLNGIAAGTALIALLALCVIAALGGLGAVFMTCLLLAAAMTGFFMHNYPDGRIFMGDAGSMGTGFFLAGIALIAAQTPEAAGGIAVVYVPLIFLPFILDVTLTLIDRALRGEMVTQAHKQHFYQRLNQQGRSHGAVSRLYMMAALSCAVIGYGIVRLPGPVEWMGTLALLVALLVAAARVNRKEQPAAGVADQPRPVDQAAE